MATGFLPDEKKKKNSFGDDAAAMANASVQRIPTAGAPAPAADGRGANTELSRNVNNGLNALGGMGVVSSVPMGMGKLAQGTALATTQPVAASVPAFRSLPSVNAALQEGAQANALAGATRTLGNAGASLNAADNDQAIPMNAAAPGGIASPSAPTASMASVPAMPAVAAAPAAPTPPLDAQAAADRAAATGFMGTLKDANQRAGAAIADVATFIPRGLAGAYDTAAVRPMRAAGINAGFMSPLLAPTGSDPASQTPFYDKIRQQDTVKAATAPATATPANAIASGTSTAGAGRGAAADPRALGEPGSIAEQVKGFAPPQPEKPQPAANPNQITATRQPNGTMSFSGGPNIGKDGGEISYTGAAGFKPSGAGVTVVPGASFANGSPAVDSALSAARFAAADRGDFGAVAASYKGNFAGGSSAGGAGNATDPGIQAKYAQLDLRDPSNIAARNARIGSTGISNKRLGIENYAKAQAAQNATTERGQDVTRESALMQNETARRGQDVTAGTAQATNALAQQRIGIEGQELGMKQTAAGFTSRAAARIESLQTAYESAKPEDRSAIAEQLRVLTGKDKPAEWKAIALQGSTDAYGNKTEGVLATVNERTGEAKRLDQGAPQAKPLPPKAQLIKGQTYQTPRGPARWDGAQFVPA